MATYYLRVTPKKLLTYKKRRTSKRRRRTRISKH